MTFSWRAWSCAGTTLAERITDRAPPGIFSYLSEFVWTRPLRPAGRRPNTCTAPITDCIKAVEDPPEIIFATGARILTKPLAQQALDSLAFIRDVDTPVWDAANRAVQVQIVEHRAKSDTVRLLKSKHGESRTQGFCSRLRVLYDSLTGLGNSRSSQADKSVQSG